MASREKRSLNSFRFDESDDGDAKALGRFSHRLAGLARSDQHELHRVTTTSCRSMTRSSTERIVVGRVSVCQQNHASALGRSLTGPQDPYSLPWYNSASRVPTASSDSLPPCSLLTLPGGSAPPTASAGRCPSRWCCCSRSPRCGATTFPRY
jgi:hypothetical protein